MFCKECGNELPANSKFCPYCGTGVDISKITPQNYSIENNPLREEYKRLYELYLQKSDDELKDILNPQNGYTEIAMRAASDILQFGRITSEEALNKCDINNELSSYSAVKERNSKSTPTWLWAVAIICGLIALAVLISGAFDFLKVSGLSY